MRKILLALVSFIFLASLTACLPDPAEDTYNIPNVPSQPSSYTYRFENASSYKIKIIPASGADWDGFDFESGQNKTITTKSMFIQFSYSPSNLVKAESLIAGDGKKFVDK